MTEENKKEFVKTYCHAKLVTEVSQFFQAIKFGFLEIIPIDLLLTLSEKEFSLAICGELFIDGLVCYF